MHLTEGIGPTEAPRVCVSSIKPIHQTPPHHTRAYTHADKTEHGDRRAPGLGGTVMTMDVCDQPAAERDRAIGRQLRDLRPPSWLAEWTKADDRDPLGVLDTVAVGRRKGLVKMRDEAMSADAPTFLRGAAGVMAADLARWRLSTSGITVDICGDAHLGNFGVYGSPERSRVFDVNDFDEARPGPWEWDICRLTTSIVVTAEDRMISRAATEMAAEEAVEAYATTVAALSRGDLIDRWFAVTHYDKVTASDLGMSAAAGRLSTIRKLLPDADPQTQREATRDLTHDRAFKATKKQRPLSGVALDALRKSYEPYLDTLAPGLRRLLDGYEPLASATRAVGKGSLGLNDYLLLLESSHGGALILQVKEATPSQLNFGLSPLVARHEGQRVIEMQRTMQGASDPLLGWTSLGGADYYVRQYRDMKWAPDPTELSEGNLASYARLCATALARAHARGADPASGALAQISGYITDSPGQPRFAEAMVAFAHAYAKVTTHDRDALKARR